MAVSLSSNIPNFSSSGSNQVSNALSAGSGLVSSAPAKIGSAINSVKNAADISSRINSLQNNPIAQKAKENIAKAQGAINDLSGAVQDPIGFALKKVLKKVNNLTGKIETKIDELYEQVAKKADFNGRIEVTGTTISIIVSSEEAATAMAVKQNVEQTVKSIKTTITVLKTTIQSLQTLGDTLKAIQIALDIQELAMMINPATKAMFSTMKLGIKILFTKEILKEHAKVLIQQLSENKVILDRLIQKFSNINIQIKISDEGEKGNVIDDQKAAQLLADDLLAPPGYNGLPLNNLYDQYRVGEKEYELVVEKYGNGDQLIGKAKDKFSGLLVAETAPSYFATSDQLLQELKNILDLGI